MRAVAGALTDVDRLIAGVERLAVASRLTARTTLAARGPADLVLAVAVPFGGGRATLDRTGPGRCCAGRRFNRDRRRPSGCRLGEAGGGGPVGQGGRRATGRLSVFGRRAATGGIWLGARASYAPGPDAR